jgi:hypothetical protein
MSIKKRGQVLAFLITLESYSAATMSGKAS